MHATATPDRSAPTFDLTALTAGEPTAWRVLLLAHGPMVYALCRRLDPDPDDAYQAVWERVHDGLSRLDPVRGGELGGWLRTVARRALIDRHRRRRAQGALVERLRRAPPPPAPDPTGALDAQQQRDRLEAALGRLPPGQRRAVVLHHVDEAPLGEIADLEGVPVNTIKSRLHRGRARLARLLGGRDA